MFYLSHTIRKFRDTYSLVREVHLIPLSARRWVQISKDASNKMAESSVVSDVKNMLKPELRSFLLARGITVTDYNVSQLRELAIKASEMKLPVISQKDDAIDSFRKRSTIALKDRVINFPFVCDVSLKSWTYDLSGMPDIVCADIFAIYSLMPSGQQTAPSVTNKRGGIDCLNATISVPFSAMRYPKTICTFEPSV